VVLPEAILPPSSIRVGASPFRTSGPSVSRPGRLAAAQDLSAIGAVGSPSRCRIGSVAPLGVGERQDRCSFRALSMMSQVRGPDRCCPLAWCHPERGTIRVSTGRANPGCSSGPEISASWSLSSSGVGRQLDQYDSKVISNGQRPLDTSCRSHD